MISSVRALVKALGGPKKLSSILGCSTQAIEWWIEDKQIPEGWHYRLYYLAGLKGITIDPHKVFGLAKDFGQTLI